VTIPCGTTSVDLVPGDDRKGGREGGRKGGRALPACMGNLSLFAS
jgi:hypothetical protein